MMTETVCLLIYSWLQFWLHKKKRKPGSPFFMRVSDKKTVGFGLACVRVPLALLPDGVAASRRRPPDDRTPVYRSQNGWTH